MYLILYAIPVFFLLIGVEILVSYIQRRATYRLNDSINDLSMGIIDQVGGAFLKSVVFVGYLYVYQNYRLFEIPLSATWPWIACLLMYDLMYYWAHRASHEINFMWGSHIPHHQSEEYNLSVALRQGVFQGCFFWLFYLPLALVGFPPAMFITMANVDTLYQFWIHTRTIGKLGPLEWVFNTPSHHRVHHAKNPKYIDRNHGGILIIWDRMFGTFKEEEEEPVYGTATPLRSWNPVWANVHYWIDLAKLAWRAPRWRDKFLVWFMKPAWRPKGLEKTGPAAYLTRDFYQKYHPRVPVGLSWYCLTQFTPVLVAGTAFLVYEESLHATFRAAAAAWVIGSLTSIGGIFESKRWAFRLECARQVITGAAAIAWIHLTLGLHRLEGLTLAGAVILLVVAMLNWLVRYHTVFTRPAGKVEISPNTTLPVEAERLPSPAPARAADQFVSVK